MIVKELSEDEADLIEAIRNLRRSFPNEYEAQVYYVTKLFEEMIDLPVVHCSAPIGRAFINEKTAQNIMIWKFVTH